MLHPSLYIPNIPGLDEALPLDVYAALVNQDPDVIVSDIQARKLLGARFEGEWYVEAPPFCEDRLQRIWEKRRLKHESADSKRRSEHKTRNEDEIGEEIEANPELRYARILNLKGKVSKQDVKSRWRELAAQYHPDKVSHLGPKLRQVAEEEMTMINEAYDYFRHKYQI